MAESELPTGIEKTFYGSGAWRGYRVSVWIPACGYEKGRVVHKRFPKTATFEEMTHWREDQRVDARRRIAAGTPLPAVVTGFAALADRFLETQLASPNFKERTRYVRMWVDVFGERDPAGIQSSEIRAQCEQWRTRGPRWVYVKRQRVLKPLPLSPQEVNLRLRVLENMWTVMLPAEPNIVREVPEYGEAADAKPRGQSFTLCYEVRDYMPDLTTPKPGELPEAGSLSRIRFEVMFLTGLEPKQIGRLEESDVDYSIPSIVVPARQKGHSSKRRKRPRRIMRARPLLREAIPALQRLFALGGNRPFSHSSLGRSIDRAVTAANLVRAAADRPLIDTTLRPKDWTRHSCGTEIYRRTGDLKMVQEFLGLSDIRMAEIYAESAVQEHMLAAAAKMDAAVRQARRNVEKARRAIPRLREHHRVGGKRGGGEGRGEGFAPKTTPFDRSPRLAKRKNPQ